LRLDQISKLKKKYGNSIEEILEFLNQCEQKLDTIIFSDKYKEKLEYKLLKKQAIVLNLAKNLSKKRTEAALLLEEKSRVSLNF
jgi:DNA repair protein RecN (Recombination protein N)